MVCSAVFRVSCICCSCFLSVCIGGGYHSDLICHHLPLTPRNNFLKAGDVTACLCAEEVITGRWENRGGLLGRSLEQVRRNRI